MKVRELLNEKVIQTSTLAKDIMSQIELDNDDYWINNSKYIIYFKLVDGKFKKINAKDESNLELRLIIKSVKKSDEPTILTANTVVKKTNDLEIHIYLSHIPTSKGVKFIKRDLNSILIHELTHFKQVSREKPRKNEDEGLTVHQIAKKDAIKMMKRRKMMSSFKLLVKKYFSNPTELMAYANQMSQVLDLKEFKKLSKEIKYDPTITSMNEIKDKYKNHKWFVPETKILFIYLTVYKRSDRAYKRLTKYFVEYLQNEEKK